MSDRREAKGDFPDYLLNKNQQQTPENIALFEAALNGDAKEVKRLISQGALPNFFHRPDDQKNALHVAAENDHVAVVEVLLQNGAVVGALAAADQTTAIVLAARRGSSAVMEKLLDAGANINDANSYGNTALHEACHGGNIRVAETLINRGAVVNACNKKGSTPFHVFCYSESLASHPVSFARYLLDNGADLNIRDARGMTPFLVCCSSGRSDLIELLAEKGANVFERDDSGRNGIEIATFFRQERVFDVLERLMRKGK